MLITRDCWLIESNLFLLVLPKDFTFHLPFLHVDRCFFVFIYFVISWSVLVKYVNDPNQIC